MVFYFKSMLWSSNLVGHMVRELSVDSDYRVRVAVFQASFKSINQTINNLINQTLSFHQAIRTNLELSNFR